MTLESGIILNWFERNLTVIGTGFNQVLERLIREKAVQYSNYVKMPTWCCLIRSKHVLEVKFILKVTHSTPTVYKHYTKLYHLDFACKLNEIWGFRCCKYCLVSRVPWLVMTGCGLDDWIYWHLLLQSLITAHNRWLPKTRSIPYWTTSVFSSSVTELVLIYESVTSITSLSAG
jgi:hypothetical protein